MHQSGHSRAHSMQTVQFSSFRAITPRARVGGASFSFGYCTVTAGSSIVLNVTPSPLMRPFPGMSGIGCYLVESDVEKTIRTRPCWFWWPSEGHLQDSGDEDV